MDTPEVCNGGDEDGIPLPGFRFHPTDEELVSFYLRRKVDKRPIKLELIREINIYKHSPWDLPYASSNAEDKEWYFYCKRGRKYKNSIRPNRVTESGFWKATGIDKPVYSNGGEGNECIGLKKTLVYYRGSAGKGTKTDWMMHEFRLPPPIQTPQKHQPDSKNFAEEAEIWTLCRIFKRNVSCRRYGISNWSKQTPTKNPMNEKNTTKLCNMSDQILSSCESMIIHNEHKPILIPNYPNNHEWNNNNYESPVSSGIISPPIPTNNNNNNQLDVNDFFTNSNWDELRSMVEYMF